MAEGLYDGALARRCVTFADRCKSGKGISPAYLPGTTGLKDVRLSANAKLHIRVKSRVGLSNGSTDDSAALREFDQPIRNPRRRTLSEPRKITSRQRRGMGNAKKEAMKSAFYR